MDDNNNIAVQLGTFEYYQYLRLNLYSHVETDKQIISHPLASRQIKFLKIPSGRLFFIPDQSLKISSSGLPKSKSRLEVKFVFKRVMFKILKVKATLIKRPFKILRQFFFSTNEILAYFSLQVHL